MSVVGFDIGNNNCFVAIARAGGIETVANEYSDRCSPAIVAFNSLQRLVGTSAKNQMISNYKSTVTQIKRLIGRKFDEPSMKAEFSHLAYECIRMDTGDIGIKVNYRGEERIFLPEQIMAMVLTYLKQTAESNVNGKVTDCVISVPAFYTDHQRRALLCASQIAGLNCLKVMNETSAVALNYGLFKQDVPPPEEKPRHVAFIDVGHSAYQVCIAAFNKGKIKILSSSWDDSLGGRDFDNRLREYFSEEILKKYKIDARTNKRAWIRLGTEVEKIKKQIGCNTTNIPLNIECFMEDKDVSCSINRGEFESFCADLIDRVEAPLQRAINDSGLKLEEIDVVELVGGSTRIPAIRQIFEKVFNKPYSTTLNQDEAVVRGCAIQCAMMSHTVKVRDIEVMDAASYPIHISWDCTKNEEQYGEMEVFKIHHAYPFTKLLTFPHRVEPFCFRAYYNEILKIPHLDRGIGEFVVNALAPAESSEKVKVKVRVRLDHNGCFTVSSASMVETLPLPVENGELMETNAEANVENMNTENKPNEEKDKAMDTSNQDDNTPKKEEAQTQEISEKPEEMKENKKPEPKKPKKSTKSTDLIVSKKQKGPTSADLNVLIEQENELIAQVRQEKERSDAKNAVEEYVYSMRGKISDEYEMYIAAGDRELFGTLLNNTENWLYEDGEDETKSIYVDKLAELRKIGQPVVDRFYAHTNLPMAMEQFGTSILHYRKILDLYSQKNEKYEHIEESEMKKVEKRVEDKFKWYNEKLNEKCPLEQNPSVQPSEVLNEKKMLENFVNPIINKPKPKVEPPKDEPPKDDATKDKKDPSTGDSTDSPPTHPPPTDPSADQTAEPTGKMETDQKDTVSDPPQNDLDMEVD